MGALHRKAMTPAPAAEAQFSGSAYQETAATPKPTRRTTNPPPTHPHVGHMQRVGVVTPPRCLGKDGGDGTGDEAAVGIALRPTSDGEGLAASRLPKGEDSAVVAIEGSAQDGQRDTVKHLFLARIWR